MFIYILIFAEIGRAVNFAAPPWTLFYTDICEFRYKCKLYKNERENKSFGVGVLSMVDRAEGQNTFKIETPFDVSLFSREKRKCVRQTSKGLI